MNKKLLLLLVPLLLLPLLSFGYAHFTDKVVKKYRVHVGSLEVEFIGIHVDACRMPDVDNDGEIFGDELVITTYENPEDCTWYIYITADPITGGFYLNTTMWLHNSGKLPFELRWETMWDGPKDYFIDTDVVNPDWTNAFDPPKPGYSVFGGANPLPMPPWSFAMDVYRWHLGDDGVYRRTGPFTPTQVDYKPCDYLEIKQHINFKQPDPEAGVGEDWQKDWQCKFIRLWVEFTAQDVYWDFSSNLVGEWPDEEGLPAKPPLEEPSPP